MVTLTLLLSALIGCSGPRTVVLPEARTARLAAGDPAPFAGWLLTDGAMVRVLEAAERCQGGGGE